MTTKKFPKTHRFPNFIKSNFPMKISQLRDANLPFLYNDVRTMYTPYSFIPKKKNYFNFRIIIKDTLAI